MKIGIMQPYFFPYIGYYQLLSAVDEFIVYDNIEFSKKGWVNRNRILVNGADVFVSIPLKKDSDFLNIVDRSLSDTWGTDRQKILNRIKEAYRMAPFFPETFQLIENVLLSEEKNLFRFLLKSLELTKNHLGISTPLLTSSDVPIDHSLKAQNKVIAIASARNATRYINPVGGLDLYSKENFKKEGIELVFLKTSPFDYKQFKDPFVPNLSIIDVMMFNSINNIKGLLSQYSFI
jgi:hypothetical protein